MKEQGEGESVNPVMTEWEKRRLEQQHRVLEAAKDMIAKLRLAGVVSVTAAYDGSGDSGQVDSIEFTFENNETVTAETRYDQKCYQLTADWGAKLDANVGETAVKAIECLVYEVLKDEHPGWEINDGSDGEVIIDLLNGVGVCQHNERYIESEYFESEFEI